MKLGITAAAIAIASAATMAAYQAKTAPPAVKTTTSAAASDRVAIEKTLIGNEIKVTDAFAKNDAAAFKGLVDPAALSLEDTGLVPVSEFVKLLEAGQVKVTSPKADGFKVQWVDANTAIVTYKWTGNGTVAGQPVKSPTQSSTVWTKKGDKWLAVFHQETPVAPAAPAKK